MDTIHPPSSRHIVVIDPNTAEREQYANALMSIYRISQFPDIETAVALLTDPPALLLVDEMARPSGHLHLIRSLQTVLIFHKVPIILFRSGSRPYELTNGLPDIMPDATLEKPFRRSALVNTISSLLNAQTEAGWTRLATSPRLTLQNSLVTFNHVAELIQKGEALSHEDLQCASLPLVESVLNSEYRDIMFAILGHDNFSFVHSVRVATLLVLLGHNLGLKGESLLLLATGGLLHDIGKMSIPCDVLNKPSALTDEEMALVQSHVVRGFHYLEHHAVMPKGIMTIVGEHHERLDGSGYPNKLKGDQLNDLARMAAIVDVFVAMTEYRPYRPVIEAEKTLHSMVEEMGAQLDTKLLKLFQEMLLDSSICVWDKLNEGHVVKS